MAAPARSTDPMPPNAGVPVATAAPGGCPVSARAADFDPFGASYQQSPPDYVAWARQEEPVFFAPSLGYWVVTRYDDVKAVFRDNITFSPAIALEKITPTCPAANDVLATYGYAIDRTLVNEDEPEHMARRRLLMAPFAPEALARHEPMVRRLTREYVDRFIDDGRVDLVDAMLWEVPLTVALHFLGVPEDDMDTLRRYSIAHTVNTWGRPTVEEQVDVAHAVGNFWTFSGQVLEKLRRDPSGPGWMPYSIRLQAQHPEIVTDSYLHSMMFAGIVAAHETTANASANAMKTLLTRREVWDQICADTSLIPNTVEECLRADGSVAAWRRVATTDTTVGGIAIPAGSKLLIMQSSANHDAAHFPHPDHIDVRRENASDHLTFGFGAHQCLGKNLARMEMQIFLEEFTRRLPHLELVPDQEFTYVANTSFRGPEHVWVQWDPALNPERTQPELLDDVTPVRLGAGAKGLITRPARVVALDRVADRVVRVRLTGDHGATLPQWTPGAHIDLVCGDTGISRQYSLCGDPAQADIVEIAVLHEPASRGGSEWVHTRLAVGDTVDLRGPRNHFRFDDTARHVIFLAGGIGITPMLSMARQARAEGLSYELHYLGRRRSHLAFVDDLVADHGGRLHLHLADEGGRADLSTILGTPRPDVGIYACGPARMLEELATLGSAWPQDSIHVEHFESSRGGLDPSREHGFEVELAASGASLDVRADQTLLGALRAADIDVPSDCEEGLCGTCEVPVLAGDIDHRDLVLTRVERESGQRLMSCCSRAQGTRLVLDL